MASAEGQGAVPAFETDSEEKRNENRPGTEKQVQGKESRSPDPETKKERIAKEQNEMHAPSCSRNITPEKESVIKGGSTTEEESENLDRDYESEPTSSGLEASKGSRKKYFPTSQGKTFHPRSRGISKELRELTRKHALLEKNLKIEGMPEPPRVRKRRLSLSANLGRSHDKDVPYKRKRLASLDLRPKRDHMPKWGLLGGDATDPLNLNGLATSEEGRILNLKTPESSPLPTPDFRKIVYVKVPPNIEDPLNLEGKHDQRVIDMMLSSTVRKRHRSKKKSHDVNQAKEVVDNSKAAFPIKVEESQNKTLTKETTEPSTPLKNTASGSRSRSRSISTSPDRKFKRQISGGGKGKAVSNEPKKFPEKPMFTLGNYNRYYGYRNRDRETDARFEYFDTSWFEGKDVLDIGCNVGHITLAIAEQLRPHKILGLDIDAKLIQAARQNIRHMLSLRRKDSSKYPRIFEITRGPLEAHPLMGSSDQFPNNVLFSQGNYIPGSEEILKLQKEEYDTILALSITKWIHLNNGDHGLKLFFQKIFRQLRPGGRLILEPQPWSTYRKRAKLSPELFKNYTSIKLKPEGFKHYLLSIGFVKCEVIGVPTTKARGFRRPLILFTKADSRGSSCKPQQTPEGTLYPNACTECANEDLTFCEHIQFTGMRRGAYASRMYDHITYHPSSSRGTHGLSSYPQPPYNYPSVQSSGGSSHHQDQDPGEASASAEPAVPPNAAEGNSSSGSGSGSASGSGSSGTCSSSVGSSTTGSTGSYSSPLQNGNAYAWDDDANGVPIPNGDLEHLGAGPAEEMQWEVQNVPGDDVPIAVIQDGQDGGVNEQGANYFGHNGDIDNDG